MLSRSVISGSSVHGILQASILEWVAIPFSKGYSWPRDWTQVSFTEPPGKLIYHVCLFSCVWLFVTTWLQPARLLCPWDFPGKNTGVGCHFLLQGIFLTRYWTCISCIGRRIPYHRATQKPYVCMLFKQFTFIGPFQEFSLTSLETAAFSCTLIKWLVSLKYNWVI